MNWGKFLQNKFDPFVRQGPCPANNKTQKPCCIGCPDLSVSQTIK